MPARLPQFRPVALFLAGYCVLLILGSLYPFRGWEGLEGWSAAFVADPLPRYITRHDITTNLLVYLPLGYALALLGALPRRRLPGILLAVLLGGAFSFALESLQQLLPSRVASNLDVYLNTVGTLVGASLAVHHGRWLRAWGAFRHWRRRWFQPHGPATPGLWLLLLWAFSQFALLPFPGLGWLDLHLRPIDTPPAHLAQLNLPWFLAVFLEMAAVGTFASTLLKPGRYVSAMLLLFLTAFLLKLLAASVMLKLRVLGGILSLETLAAFLAALWFLLLPVISRRRRTWAALLAGLILAGRLAWVEAPLWPASSLVNLVGLAAHVGALWPVLVLAQLLLVRAWPRPATATPSGFY